MIDPRKRLVLSYGKMIEDQGGPYRLVKLSVFNASAEQDSGAAGEVLVPVEAFAALVEWMSAAQSCRVVVLPVTARTGAWCCGLVFSVTPTDGEGRSRVFTVMLGERGCRAMNR